MVYIVLFNRFFFEGRGGGGGGGGCVNGCVLKINKFIKIDFCFFKVLVELDYLMIWGR